MGRYQEEIGKDFKRITMYLCTSDDFLHSEGAESPMENEDSDSAQEFNIQPKRLKEDCFNCDVVDWDLTEFEDTADLINNDEAFAIELQRQLQGESSSQNSFQTSVDEKAFQSLIHLEMNALDMDSEDCMTATEKQVIDSVKINVNLQSRSRTWVHWSS